MTKIAILGAGVMGTAFSTPFADNGHTINLVGTHLDADVIEEIHETRVHPRLRVRVPDRLQPYTYDRLGEAIQGAELLVVGVNSLGIDWAAQQLSQVLPPDLPVLFLTKGLAGHARSLQILPHALRDGLPAALRNSVRLAAIGGPSIAGELAVRRHTCVVVTGPDQALLDKLAGLLRTPYYHVWTNTDLIGVEVCVALKNVYALAVGLVIGLLEKEGAAVNDAVMHNTAAALFAQGLWETAYLVEEMGGQQQSVFTLPGAGDLYVTAQGGRNCRMGRYLGLGMRYSEAKAQYMPDDTIEGAELALAIGATVTTMIAEGKLAGDRLPLLQTMLHIVCQDAPVTLPWERFFAH